MRGKGKTDMSESTHLPFEFSAIEKFSFLVEGEKFKAANTVRYEQIDILLGIDFEELRWREMLTELNQIITAYPLLPFFKADETLIEKYVGPCLIGQEKYNKFTINMRECFKYKDESTPDTQISTCNKTPINIKKEEIERDIQNIRRRYGDIDGNWTPSDIRTSGKAQSALFEFCSYFNDFSLVYEGITDEMLAAMDLLTDNTYPEIMFGEITKDCNNTVKGHGEKYDVVKCRGTNKGLRCQIMITQSINLKEYTRLIPVHYHNIRITGDKDKNTLAITPEIGDFVYLDCEEKASGDYSLCSEEKIPGHCKEKLIKGEITGIIDNCNFTEEMPQPGIIIPHGGILIQGDDLIISNNRTNIRKPPPLIVYSPETITIRTRDEDYVFPPSIYVEKQVIVESRLSEKDIEYLLSVYKWDKIMENQDYGDYIDYLLIILEIIIFPIALGSCYLNLKQRKYMRKPNNKKGRGKETFKQNQYLLQKL